MWGSSWFYAYCNNVHIKLRHYFLKEDFVGGRRDFCWGEEIFVGWDFGKCFLRVEKLIFFK
jgi:hypothetical protein